MVGTKIYNSNEGFRHTLQEEFNTIDNNTS